MNIIVVGAGNIGYYLTWSLITSTDHEITVIEKNNSHSIAIADKLDVPIINGDGSNIAILEKANAAHTDILVALTGKDEDNFICCQLAKKHFHIKTTIAKVNNPKNFNIMKSLSSDIVISSANMLAEIIEQEVNAVYFHFATRVKMGDISIVEFIVSEGDPIQNKKIVNIAWPKDTLVIAISRKGKSIVPSGDTILSVGDNVIISTKDHNKKYLRKLFNTNQK